MNPRWLSAVAGGAACLITISLLGLILNGALEGLRSYLLRGFPEV